MFVTTIAGALGITNKHVRAGLVSFGKHMLARWSRAEATQKLILAALKEQEENKKVIAEIRYELKPNGGGSIKDAVNRIESGLVSLRAHDNHRFRILPYPAFECDSKGKNKRISDAYLDLLGIKATTDLSSLDWQRFIHNEDIETYYKAFLRAVENKSDFGHTARFYNDKRQPIGRWYVKAPRLDSGCYLGTLIPQDQRARDLADANGWE